MLPSCGAWVIEATVGRKLPKHISTTTACHKSELADLVSLGHHL